MPHSHDIIKIWFMETDSLRKENMLCNNYTITAKHLQFLFLMVLWFVGRYYCLYKLPDVTHIFISSIHKLSQLMAPYTSAYCTRGLHQTLYILF